MKLLILGATGNTGKQLVMQAGKLNHEVTVLVRDPSKFAVADPKIKVLAGDVLDKNILNEALKGQDAVISALGVGEALKSNNLISKATEALIPAMNAAGVKRLIFLSAFGVGETYHLASLLQKIAFRYILNDIYADKAIADEQIRNSSLEWTLVSPTKLTNGSRSGKYKVGEKLKASGFPMVSRADVAAFMLGQLSDSAFLRKNAIIL
jgi:putative NADH-flavin reductase